MEAGKFHLGRMGANTAERLMKAGHQCIVDDTNAATVEALTAKGRAARPKLMLPAVDPGLHSLVPLLEADDIVIKSGCSYYHDGIHRAKELKPKGLHYVDVGATPITGASFVLRMARLCRFRQPHPVGHAVRIRRAYSVAM
jgi:6-phosphogluconate dehydrogenase